MNEHLIFNLKKALSMKDTNRTIEFGNDKCAMCAMFVQTVHVLDGYSYVELVKRVLA